MEEGGENGGLPRTEKESGLREGERGGVGRGRGDVAKEGEGSEGERPVE